MSNNETVLDEEALAKRRVPCLATYLHPFRIVNGPDMPPWDASIQQINSQTWDYVALHEIVGGIDVGLDSPYHLAVCRDGGLALPPIPTLRNEIKAVEYFNHCLAAFLIGGIYCEAITLDNLEFGSIIDWKFIRIAGQATASTNRFHNLVRGLKASPFEAIALEEPRTVEISELQKAASAGRKILSRIPQVGGQFLLRGATGYARRDWGVALANLWIVVEQLTSYLWEERIISEAKGSDAISGRIDSLQDNRTWTMGVRHEVLFQRQMLPPSAFSELNKARKARNRLSHIGQHPDEAAATSALNAVKELLAIVVPDAEIPFLNLDLGEHGLSDPFRPKDKVSMQPKYWMEIKKLPGEAELEKLEARLESLKSEISE